MTDRDRLFIIGGLADPGDPLDPLDAVRPALALVHDVIDVRPGGAMTIRGVMQQRRPARDVVLFDFTDPVAVMDMVHLPRRLPGVVLLGAGQPIRAQHALHAWQREAIVSPDEWPRSVIVALGAKIDGCLLTAERMVAQRPPAVGVDTGRFLCFGRPKALYGAMLAWDRWQGKPDGAALTLACATASDAATVRRMVALRDPADDIDVVVAARRGDVAALCEGATCVADLLPLAWPGQTDALLAAAMHGVPACRVDGPLAGVADAVGAFWAAMREGRWSDSPADPPRAGALAEILNRALALSREQSRRHEAAA